MMRWLDAYVFIFGVREKAAILTNDLPAEIHQRETGKDFCSFKSSLDPADAMRKLTYRIRHAYPPSH